MTVVVALMLTALAAVAETNPTPPIDVGKGQQRIITVEGDIRRVATGDDAIADVRQTGPHEVVVLGVSKGLTTLLVWTQGDKRKSYLVRVERRDPVARLEQLKPLLSGIEGVASRIIGDELFLFGIPPTLEQEIELRAVLLEFPDVHVLPECRGGGVQLNNVRNKERQDRERDEFYARWALKQYRLTRARCGWSVRSISSACGRSCR